MAIAGKVILGSKLFVQVANLAGDSGDMSACPKLIASEIASGLDYFKEKQSGQLYLPFNSHE